jgi:hypothetical protein
MSAAWQGCCRVQRVVERGPRALVSFLSERADASEGTVGIAMTIPTITCLLIGGASTDSPTARAIWG